MVERNGTSSSKFKQLLSITDSGSIHDDVDIIISIISKMAAKDVKDAWTKLVGADGAKYPGSREKAAEAMVQHEGFDASKYMDNDTPALKARLMNAVRGEYLWTLVCVLHVLVII